MQLQIKGEGRQNFICPKNDGSEINDIQDMPEVAIDFYKYLFGKEEIMNIDLVKYFLEKEEKISDEENDFVDHVISEVEVREA
jgi:predicted RecB family nuclease